MKKLLVLGSTGSIGTSTLQVVDQHPDQVEVIALAAGHNLELLLTQIARYSPQAVSTLHPAGPAQIKAEFPQVAVFTSATDLVNFLAPDQVEVVIAGISGVAGLEPTWACLAKKWRLGLANKEVLVTAGELLMAEVADQGVELIPVDSEHSAIWQCLQGVPRQSVAKAILTCSGGPLQDLSSVQLAEVTPAQALAHPTWSMGSKISLDSATLMNKGLETIEAHQLFNLDYDQLEVLIHPQSYVHSLIELVDGTQLAQLSQPSMTLPIQLALSYPHRWPNSAPKTSLIKASPLTFSPPDLSRFPCLDLAIQAGRLGGSSPTVLNAANEVAGSAFLSGKIKFIQIPSLVEQALTEFTSVALTDLEQLLSIDQTVRNFTHQHVNQLVRQN